MNIVDAHDTARRGADRFGNRWRVFRLPTWPTGVYGCNALELPSEAEILATYPDNAGPKSTVAGPQSPAAPTDAQGSLF